MGRRGEGGWGGAPSAMKRTFLPSWEHIWRPPLIELDRSTLALIDFNLKFVQTVGAQPESEVGLVCTEVGRLERFNIWNEF